MKVTLDDGRTELWQWDTGRKIVVDDKSVSEVHYSKYSSTQAITREVINGKAEIPNFLLQDTHAVTVYAYSGSILQKAILERIMNLFAPRLQKKLYVDAARLTTAVFAQLEL